MIPNCQDPLHLPRDSGMRQAMQYRPVAKLVKDIDVGAHRRPTRATSLKAFATEMRDLLKCFEDGRLGINGPRIPKNVDRADQCPC